MVSYSGDYNLVISNTDKKASTIDQPPQGAEVESLHQLPQVQLDTCQNGDAKTNKDQPASSITWPVSSVTHPTESAEVVQVLSNMEGKAVDVIPSQEDCTLHQVSIQEDQFFPTTQEVPHNKVQNGAPEDHCAASVLEGEGTKARSNKTLSTSIKV